jgi:hypothetical protein
MCGETGERANRKSFFLGGGKAKMKRARNNNGQRRNDAFFYASTFTAKHISRGQPGVRHRTAHQCYVRKKKKKRVKFVVTSASIIMPQL